MHAVPWVDYYTATIHLYRYYADAVRVEAACNQHKVLPGALLLGLLTMQLLLVSATTDQTLIQYTDNLMVNR